MGRVGGVRLAIVVRVSPLGRQQARGLPLRLGIVDFLGNAGREALPSVCALHWATETTNKRQACKYDDEQNQNQGFFMRCVLTHHMVEL
jgi:hypothetical protein